MSLSPLPPDRDMKSQGYSLNPPSLLGKVRSRHRGHAVTLTVCALSRWWSTLWHIIFQESLTFPLSQQAEGRWSPEPHCVAKSGGFKVLVNLNAPGYRDMMLLSVCHRFREGPTWGRPPTLCGGSWLSSANPWAQPHRAEMDFKPRSNPFSAQSDVLYNEISVTQCPEHRVILRLHFNHKHPLPLDNFKTQTASLYCKPPTCCNKT